MHSKNKVIKMPTFGERIKELREKQGMSQRELARQLDITSAYMSKIERDDLQPPSEAVIKRMSVLLHVNQDELLSYADKVDSELLNIIKGEPTKYAALLRQWSKKNES